MLLISGGITPFVATCCDFRPEFLLIGDLIDDVFRIIDARWSDPRAAWVGAVVQSGHLRAARAERAARAATVMMSPGASDGSGQGAGGPAP
jgi:hypothetical protein